MQNLTTLAITSWSWAVQPKEGSGNHSNFLSTIQNRSPTMGFSSKASWAAFSITFTVDKRLREGRRRQPCLKDLIWVSALSCGLGAAAYSSGVLVRDARQSLHVVTFSIFLWTLPTQVVYYHVLNAAVGASLAYQKTWYTEASCAVSTQWWSWVQLLLLPSSPGCPGMKLGRSRMDQCSCPW